MSSNASLVSNSGRSLLIQRFLGLPSMSFCVIFTYLLKRNSLYSLTKYSKAVIYFKSVKLFNNSRSSSFNVFFHCKVLIHTIE